MAPEKTGDIAEDLIAQAKFVLAKIKACKTAEEFGAIEEDQCMKDFEALMSKAEQEATPEQKEKIAAHGLFSLLKTSKIGRKVVNLRDIVRTCMRARVKGLHRAKKCLANIL